MCPYFDLFWFAFSRIWTEYEDIRSISPYSVRMRENADQNNSEYGQFLRKTSLKEDAAGGERSRPKKQSELLDCM